MIGAETDPGRCRELWDRLSPKEGAWDDRDLMFAFHDEKRHRFHFLVHESDEGQPDGLVALVYATTEDRYMLMGGNYPDGRILWLENQNFPEFFEQFPERTVLFDLKESWVSELLRACPEFESNFIERDLRYCLVPAEFDLDFHHHIDNFAREKRQKFLYDFRKIHKRDPVLNWSTDNEADLFIDLVNRNFGAESDYADKEISGEVRRVVEELRRSNRLTMLTIAIDGAKQAVSMSLLQGNRMVALYAANNNDYSNLGKLLNFETIQEACRLRVDEISYMTGMQWKANWKMTGEACITLRKPAGPWLAAVT